MHYPVFFTVAGFATDTAFERAQISDASIAPSIFEAPLRAQALVIVGSPRSFLFLCLPPLPFDGPPLPYDDEGTKDRGWCMELMRDMA